jgi:putative N6-adenine-specific DNA methylase
VKQIRIQELKLADKDTDNALVMINPPYGERLAQDKDVLRLYQDMGTTLKHQFSGANAWIISSNEEALKCVGLRPAKRIRLINGDLECLFNKYELFKGDRKTWKKSL